MKELDIYVNDVLAGKIYKEHDHGYIFRYVTQDRAAFVSLTMPVRVRDYEYQVLHPIFQMNLPEGYNLEILRKKFAKLVELDDMTLLSLVGGRQIGRVAAAESGRTPEAGEWIEAESKSLLATKGARALLTSLVEQYAPGAGISGVQPKILSAHRGRGQLFLPTASHIYKSSTEYPALAVNEYFCRLACKAAGVAAPKAALSDDGEVLQIERFDVGARGARLGFEEAFVLRGLARQGKYEGSYENMYAGLLRFVSRMNRRADAENLFRMIVMNIALRNGDAHLKNFGVIYSNADDVRLAPAYDVVTTCAYPPKDLMALSMEDSKDWPDAKRIMRFARGCAGLSPGRTNEILNDCGRSVTSTVRQLKRFAAKKPRYGKLADAIQRHWLDGLESLGAPLRHR